MQDQQGNPVRTADLVAPQTASLPWRHRVFSGDDFSGLTPRRMARILRDAEQGDIEAQCRLFEEMEERDAHIHAELSKRKRALLTLDWSIQPARGRGEEQDKKLADTLAEILLDLPDFEDVILDLADAISKGFACLEIEWRQVDGLWLPGKIHHRPQSWFQVLPDDPETIRLRDNSPTGQLLQPFGWLLHIHKAKSGYPAISGLARVLVWPYLFKHYATHDLAELLEIYGLPHRVGTYPVNATEEQKSSLLRAVVGMGHEAAGVIAEGMRIDYHEIAAARADPFKTMIEWAEKSASKAILGGTLTSQADGASSTNALGNVHNDVRRDLLISDARQIAGTLTRDLLYPLATLNFGASSRTVPRFVFDTRQPEDLTVMADALPKLATLLSIPATWAYGRMGIPQPREGEVLLGVVAAPSPAEVDQAAARMTTCPHCVTASTNPGPVEPPDAADLYGRQAMAQMGAAMDDLLGPVRKLLESSSSLEEVRDRLFDLFPGMDATAMATLLAQAMLAAELTGRDEVRRGR